MPPAVVNLVLKPMGFDGAAKSFTELNSKLALLKVAWDSIGKAVAYVKEYTAAYNVQLQSEQKLAKALKAQGLGKHAEEMKAYASELQSLTTYGDEAIMPIMALGAGATNSSEELKRLTASALDMAAATGRDMRQAMMAASRAMSGQVESLKEMGVTLSSTEAAQIKAAKGSEQHELVLAALEKRFKGFAAVVADTSQGAMTQFNNVLGDMKEDTGKILELPFKQVIQVATKGLQTLQVELNKIGSTGLNAKQALVEILNAAYDMADGTLSAVSTLMDGVKWVNDNVMQYVVKALNFVTELMLEPFIKMFNTFKEIADKIPMFPKKLKEAYGDAAGFLEKIASAPKKTFDAFTAGVDGLAKALPVVKRVGLTVVAAMQSAAATVSEVVGATINDTNNQEDDAIARNEKAHAAWLKRKLNAEKAYNDALKAHLGEVAANYIAVTNEMYERQKAQTDAMKAEWQAYGQQFKDMAKGMFDQFLDLGLDSFFGLIEGQKGLRQSFRETMGSMLKGLVKWGLQTAMTNALAAASGAMASTSAIPIIGPLIAAGVAAAIFAATTAYQKRVPTDTAVPMAMGGIVAGRVTGGSYGQDSVPIRAMDGERVLNKREAAEWEKGQRGGGNVTINVNVSATTGSKLETEKWVRNTLAPAIKSQSGSFQFLTASPALGR